MLLWVADRPLILASQSSARRALLEQVAIPIEVHPADVDERALEAANPAAAPAELARLLACAKAQAVARQFPDRVVVGADQVLALGKRAFSKPGDRAAARVQLALLRGRTHALHSGVAVARQGEIRFAEVATAHLTMRDFSEAFLDAYLDAAGAAVTASVGAYQVEGLGPHLFEHIEGEQSVILGLPLLPLLAYLRGEGLVAA